MGVIVDVPKHGYGGTNDGNTIRRFFADPNRAAEITGVDINLILRFKMILEVISRRHKIDIENFTEYVTETAKLYVEVYSRHFMTTTVHKTLIHGNTVIEGALLHFSIVFLRSCRHSE